MVFSGKIIPKWPKNSGEWNIIIYPDLRNGWWLEVPLCSETSKCHGLDFFELPTPQLLLDSAAVDSPLAGGWLVASWWDKSLAPLFSWWFKTAEWNEFALTDPFPISIHKIIQIKTRISKNNQCPNPLNWSTLSHVLRGLIFFSIRDIQKKILSEQHRSSLCAGIAVANQAKFSSDWGMMIDGMI